MSEVNGIFGNMRQCSVSLGYCALVQKLAPWTADAGGVLRHHPHRLQSVGGSVLDTPNGADEVCRKNGGQQVEAERMCLFSEKLGNGKGKFREWKLS